MWLKGLGKSELNKQMEFFNEALLLLTFFSVRKINISIAEVAIGYIILVVALIFIGKLIRDLGIVKYSTELGSFENPQLLDILDTVHRLEQKIDKELKK